jgi:RpiR family transcriptional regulator, carbohydrate utilization regulator
MPEGGTADMARRPKLSVTAVNTRPPLIPYLRGVLASLNPTEKLIAECILTDPERAISSSISQLSDACHASVGAIVGFCRRVGLKGFADFKIALARDLAQTGLPAGETSESGALYAKVFQFHAQSLTETLQLNTEVTFDRVAQALERSRRVEVFSLGLSYPVAYTAYCKFLLIGISVAAQFDTHIQLINATQLRGGDLAFGISLSGATRETIECIRVAKARGATTVCLTNAMKSPITEYSDLCLYAAPSEIKYFQAPLASRVTQLAVIDALFVSLALKHKNKTAERLQQSGAELLKRR